MKFIWNKGKSILTEKVVSGVVAFELHWRLNIELFQEKNRWQMDSKLGGCESIII